MVILVTIKSRNTTMKDYQVPLPPAPMRTPWNKGKLIGAKPPLWPKHVWSIRTRLQIEGRTRDLALAPNDDGLESERALAQAHVSRAAERYALMSALPRKNPFEAQSLW